MKGNGHFRTIELLDMIVFCRVRHMAKSLFATDPLVTPIFKLYDTKRVARFHMIGKVYEASTLEEGDAEW